MSVPTAARRYRPCRTCRPHSPPPWSTSGCAAAWPTPWCARARARRPWPWRWPPIPAMAVHVRLDERSAGFTALGIGRATGRPALVRHHQRHGGGRAPRRGGRGRPRPGCPLIACTADRPPELRDVGAPQTIDQTHLFGRSVRWFCRSRGGRPGHPVVVAVPGRPVGGRGRRRARPDPVRSTSTCPSGSRCSAIRPPAAG